MVEGETQEILSDYWWEDHSEDQKQNSQGEENRVISFVGGNKVYK